MMLKKFLSLVLIAATILTVNFVQPASAQNQVATVAVEKSEFDKTEFLQKLKRNHAVEQTRETHSFENDLLKAHVKKQNKLSSGAKTGLIVGIVAAAVVAVIVAVALGNDNDDNVSQCSAVRSPCPAGCVCAQ